MLYTILGIIIAIIIIAILFTILKSIMKVVLFTAAIIFIICIVFGLIIITDANNFKETIQNSQNTYILLNENIAIQGINVKTENNESQIEPIGAPQLDFINKKLEENDLEKIKGSSYKLIFIKTEKETEDQESFGEKIEKSFSNPINIIKNIKSEDLKVYPETTMFKFLKYLPDKLIDLISKIDK